MPRGGEKEAVVLSLVRSNPKRIVGFLSDERRLNVAITRARRQLFMVCDTDTVAANRDCNKTTFLSKLVSYAEEHGTCKSAMEYVVHPPSDVSVAKGSIDDITTVLIASQNNSSSDKLNKKKNTDVNASSDLWNGNREIIDKESNKSKQNAQQQQQQRQQRADMIKQIQEFVKKGKHGDTFITETALSGYDRMLIHEYAEEVGGLKHESKGVEGVDRRIILEILPPLVVDEKTACQSENHKNSKEGSDDVLNNFIIRKGGMQGQQKMEESIATNTKLTERNFENNIDKDIINNQSENYNNTLLKNLAQDRMRRQQVAAAVVIEEASKKNETALPTTNNGNSISHNKKKKKKKNTQKKTKVAIATSSKEDEIDDNDDDMAFLDAQIEKVQTSHGRTIDASGKKYCSVINGFLISKPQPKEKIRNQRASSALKQKLKEAERSRKSKDLHK